MNNDFTSLVGAGVIGVLIAAGLFFLTAFFVLVAWNVIASIFSAVNISYVQAMGVTVALWLIRGIPVTKIGE